MDTEQKESVVMVEMKSPQPVRSFTDFLQEKVIEKSLESLRYNLNLQVELIEKCPFPQWKKMEE
ncbi:MULTISPECIES: hypothetical protein [Bacteroides]|uniref:hypothetical protein n=1 Tax=Bacteroides TaxID=816 RepID=UPI0018AB49B0|nr:hypothetical protein [Bacteroides nordii]